MINIEQASVNLNDQIFLKGSLTTPNNKTINIRCKEITGKAKLSTKPIPKISELSQVLKLLEIGRVSEIGMSNKVELSNTVNKIKNNNAPLILAES
jgi:hypothetical protein